MMRAMLVCAALALGCAGAGEDATSDVCRPPEGIAWDVQDSMQAECDTYCRSIEDPAYTTIGPDFCGDGTGWTEAYYCPLACRGCDGAITCRCSPLGCESLRYYGGCGGPDEWPFRNRTVPACPLPPS